MTTKAGTVDAADGAARASREVSPLPGAFVAGFTAVLSGVSIFVNSYGVHSVPHAAVYTAAKNLVAAALLAVAAASLRALRPRGRRPRRSPAHLADNPSGGTGFAGLVGLAYVGVIGGGVAFVMFFEGLARTSAEPAAFLHDTMVIWVALLAVPALRERVTPWNVAAIVLLVTGQVLVTGGVGHLVAGEGELLVLGATVLWSVETVVSRRLLARIAPDLLAVVRMSVGVVVLVGFVAATGQLGALTSLTAHETAWALATGALLAGYVGTWMLALSRARALDVTSVLVGSVVVTYLLNGAFGHAVHAGPIVGLALVALGCVAVVPAWPRAARAT